MESVLQERTSGRWVLRNTFIELVEDGSPVNGSAFSSGALMRASSDSALYEGYSPNKAEETPKNAAPAEHECKEAQGGHYEFEMNGFSDTETNPDTGREREKSLPLPCYSHIKDFPSGESTPLCTALPPGESEMCVARTPSPRGMDWHPADFCEVTVKDEDFRPDPLPGVAPPSSGSSEAPDKVSSKQDLQRLAAEVARLAQENELLRQRVLKQDRTEEADAASTAGTSSQAAPQEAMQWAVFMPVNFMNAGGQTMHQDPSTDSWVPAMAGIPHSQDLMGKEQSDSGKMARRNRRSSLRGQKDADLEEAWKNTSKLRASNMSVKPAECDLPLEECTTVMLRNLPNNYTRAMLMAMLDNEGFEGKYNFLYLPIDFQSCACLGYAFVNLVDPSYVPLFWEKFSGYSKWVLPSKKVCGVSWSGPHQGLEAHVERYRNSPVMHESVPDEYKPVILQNGVRMAFPEPSKAPRPPRIRQHHHSSEKGSWHGRQYSNEGRMPLAVGALPPGSVARAS
ncbi:Protein MEI2-like 5 (AML5) (MEI2-like protein 5) [Durusdinium trenchii]|uniref:Protein MEI2-like 5 (AML5) (MEI2-like protein 5) n=1 Tax=Durusdinium trenchii TaxID=1381693 RepID=A0ABP0QTC8_9DINO